MNNPARWEKDPTGRFALRYWDGNQWTHFASPGDGSTVVDPLTSQSGPSAATTTARTTQQVATRQPSTTNSAPRARPRLSLAAQPQPQPQVPQHTFTAARVLTVPPALHIGEVHNLSVRLKKHKAIVISRVPGANEWTVVTDSGSIKSVPAAFATPAISQPPLTTRPGRLWWHLQHPLPEFSPEAVNVVRETWDALVSTVSDESIAFGLEAIAHGLDTNSAVKCGVELWQAHYEALRTPTNAPHEVREHAEAVLRSTSCPPTLRVAAALATRGDPTDVLRPWPALASAFSSYRTDGGILTDEHLTAQVVEETRVFSSALAQLGLPVAEELISVIEHPERVEGPHQRVFSALVGPYTSRPLTVSDSVALSVVDDLIDRGVHVGLDHTWTDDDRRYVQARRSPESLSDDEVIALDFTAEGRRRAFSDGLATFGHLLTPEEKLARALSQCITADGVLTEEGLAHLPDDDLTAELRQALTSQQWSELPESLVATPGIGQLLLRLPAPDRPPRSSAEAAIMGRSLLRSARDALFQWEWDAAIQHGQQALQFATEEQVRDELMNVVAAALWSSGRSKEALALLRKALEGDYTIPLVCNTAAVAATLDTGTALTELTRLVRESPDDLMRLIAAERAFAVWQSSVEDDDEAPPLMLLLSLRALLALEVTDDRYRQLLRILADHDGNWLASQPPSAFGRRQNSPEARVYLAKARGLEHYIAELAAVHHVQPRPQWVEDETVRLGRSLVGFLASSFGEENATSAVHISMEVLTSDLPLPAEVHVHMVAILSASVSQIVTDGEPKDEFVNWFHAARRRVPEIADEDDRRSLHDLMSEGGDRLGLAYLSYRNTVVNNLASTYNLHIEHANQLIRAGTLDRPAFSAVMREMAEHAQECVKTTRKAITVISDPQLKDAANALITSAEELEALCRESAR